jgi:hypothetical protein
VPPRQAADHGWPGGTGLARLARPFPLTSAWIWEDAAPPPAPGITPDQAWDGALLLGDDGCGMYWMLVVTGIHRSHVWNVTDVGAQSFGRSFGYTTAADGLAGWVAHWVTGTDWYDAPY